MFLPHGIVAMVVCEGHATGRSSNTVADARITERCVEFGQRSELVQGKDKPVHMGRICAFEQEVV